MGNKTITVVGIFNENNGITTFVKRNYGRLVAQGYKFIFVNISNARPARDLADLGEYHEATQFGKFRLWRHISDLKHIYAQVRRQSDIIHIHLDSLHNWLPISLAKKAGFKRIIIHSHSDLRGRYGRIKQLMQNHGMKVAARDATDYIACSQYAADFFYSQKTQQDPRFKVIINGIDLDQFAYDSRANEEIRQRYHIRPDDFVVGHTGRFLPQKNQAFLIRAFKEFSRHNPQAKLVLVGNGDQLPQAKKLVSLLHLDERVIFTGYVQDAAAVENIFDLFAFPSLYEGLSQALLENQAKGTPCLVSDRQSPESFWAHETFKLSLKNTSSWCAQMEKFSRQSESSRARASAANRQLLADRGMTLAHTAQALEDLYR